MPYLLYQGTLKRGPLWEYMHDGGLWGLLEAPGTPGTQEIQHDAPRAIPRGSPILPGSLVGYPGPMVH